MGLAAIERMGMGVDSVKKTVGASLTKARETIDTSCENTTAIVAYEIFKKTPRLKDQLQKPELKQLSHVFAKILGGKHIQVSQEAIGIVEDSKEKVFFHNLENIPLEGSTLIFGNHIRGGPFFDMGQFLLLAKIISEARTTAPEDKKEPILLMQDRLTRQITIKFPIEPISRLLSKIATKAFEKGTNIFYKKVAKSFGWKAILPPDFDTNGQIINDQKIGHSSLKKIKDGGALYCFPQGRHVEPDDYFFPDKTGEFLDLVSLFASKTKVVPLKAVRQEDGLHFYFCSAVPICDLPKKDEESLASSKKGRGPKIDIKKVSQKYFAGSEPTTIFQANETIQNLVL
ncbi:MAG: hypothetical protein Q8P80_01570 [Candidatus Levybacteria bacterium]|nr:hypothetical protein [Candidatus Levybacteria bacterium]